MTAGVPSGQQDLDDSHNQSLLLMPRRNEVTLVFVRPAEREPD